MMEKEITRITELLLKKGHGLLNEAEESELEAWLEQDSGNTDMLSSLADGELNDRLFSEYVAVDTGKVKQDMERRLKGERQFKRRHRSRWITGAACAAGLAIGFLFGIDGLKKSGRDSVIPLMSPAVPTLYLEGGDVIALDDTTIEMAEGRMVIRKGSGDPVVIGENGTAVNAAPVYSVIVVPKGTQYDIMLEDGSRVWLNAESRLRYPISFGEAAREVELDGEAFFDITRNSSCPFFVHSENQSVEVLGTQFNVNTYSRNKIFTTVLEGSVLVASGGCEEVLNPGMQSVVASGNISVNNVKVNHIASWRQGMFVLEGRTLDAVMSDLAGWYDFTVVYEDESLKNVSFKGVVPRADNLSAVLDLLRMTEEVDFKVRNNEVIVKK